MVHPTSCSTPVTTNRPIWLPAAMKEKTILWASTVLALVLVGASGQSCAAGEAPRDRPPPFETSLALQNARGKEAGIFERNETITMILTIRNRTETQQALTLPSAQTYDCAVSTAAGKEIWRWSKGRMFAQVVTEMTFSPGESRTFKVIWDRSRSDGSIAEPGQYRAIGSIPGHAPGTVSEAVKFSIR